MVKDRYMQTKINKYESNKLIFSGMNYCLKHDIHYSYHCVDCEQEKDE